MTATETHLLHGTAVLLPASMAPLPGCPLARDAGVLLRGPSGAGKSDLAFRLMALGAHLVADDQVLLFREEKRLMAKAPEGLHGLIELRGLGLLRQPAAGAAEIVLAVDLVARDAVPRLPEEAYASIIDHHVPVLSLHAFDVSAPLKIVVAAAVALAPERVLS